MKIYKNTDYSRIYHQNLTMISRAKELSYEIIKCFKLHIKKKEIKNSNVLDIGCSNGLVANYLSKNVKKVTGVDIDQNAINLGRSKLGDKNIKLIQYDGNTLPFKNNSFDLIILSNVISCVENPSKLMSEAYRVLKHGGLVYLRILNGTNPYIFLKYRFFLYFLTLISSIMFYKIFYKRFFYLIKPLNHREIDKICNLFVIHKMTPKILKNPQNYKHRNFYIIKPFMKLIPDRLIEKLRPLYTTYIWILEK